MTDKTECCPPQSASNPSKPNVPHPVSQPSGYKPKGTIESRGSFDEVYTVGPESKHAILVVYDIFGFWDTTFQGLDTLSGHLEGSAPAKIFMPDWFRGKAFPIDKDGDKEELGKFFQGTYVGHILIAHLLIPHGAKITDRQPEVVKFAKGLREEGYEKVSLLGYCWGGKVVLISLADSEPFDTGAIVHPAMIAPEDGSNLKVPLAFFPSVDEPKEVIQKIKEAMDSKEWSQENAYHHYDTVHHGWAAARANLKNEENKKQFEGVYKRLADFFAKTH